IFKEGAAWDELHYNPEGEQQGQIFISETAAWHTGICTEDATIEQQLSLYINRMTRITQHDEIVEHPAALAVATLLHEASLASFKKQFHPWHKLAAMVRNGGSDLWRDWKGASHHTVSITANEYADLQPLCQQLNQLGDFIKLTPELLTLPTAKDAPSQAWRRFLEGKWFELLIVDWLRQQMEGALLLPNVKVFRDENDINGREIDLVIRQDKRLLMVELKADTVDYRHDVGQLESLKNSVGAKLGSLLLCAPQYYANIKDPVAVLQRVRPSRLGLAFDKESLFQLITGKLESNWLQPITPDKLVKRVR
ncbi:MAG: hypothetical protein HQL31_10570, partial [Planctomycetes bacterium]|nr:hypothetical protein [Planctomycetota bacterium]